MLKIFVPLFVAMLFAAPCFAHARESELRLKSAYIVKFTQYIEWPAEYLKEGAAFKVIVLGNSTMLEEMRKAVGTRRVHGRAVELGSVLSEDPAIVIVDSKSSDWSEVQKRYLGKPVLLVNGGEKVAAPFTVQFFVKDERLRFEISPSAAKNQNLKISSQLMKLALVKD